eukprot:GFUD01033250.1.p1 GENE.GFUD01033250.1~~GFUD01033250.1.p1  ORF type:complete len:462 (+),score=155.08 GFUD01033250.1:419-1804(+)
MEVIKVGKKEPIDDRYKDLKNEFEKKFVLPPDVLIRVPGRVNLIGEHIDYCGYAVLPMAIEQDVLVAVSKQAEGGPGLTLCNVDTKYAEHQQDILADMNIPEGSPSWWKYFMCGLKGVKEEFKRGEPAVGLNILVSGSIPPSAGLSSSSALVVSAALVNVWGLDISVDREELAGVCARSERFIGTQGGGMDQAIELLAQEGSAKLIEFGPLKTFSVTLPTGATFVVANSLEEKNKAASNDFNTRVVECRLAAKIIAKKLLAEGEWKELMKMKDVQEHIGVEIAQMVEKVESVLHEEDYTVQEVMEILEIDKEYLQKNILTANTQNLATFRLYQRAMHVYSEAARVYQFRDVCQAAGENSLTELGELMFASHQSCAGMYQCSSSGLDCLVELSKKFGALGARLTGAGWGGCIVALVEEKSAAKFIENLKTAYYEPMQLGTEELNSAIFVTRPGQGASLWSVR